VVAWAGPGARLELAPCGVVALGKVFGRPIRVSVVAQGEDRDLDATDEPDGCLVALPAAVGDVVRRDNDPGRRSRGLLRSAAKGEKAPRRVTRAIGANLLLLILELGGVPSMSEATAEPAAIILTNFETAITLLVRGSEDSPRASSPWHRCLHNPDTTLRKQASFGYSPKCVEGEF
jgi:hypothetical protein